MKNKNDQFKTHYIFEHETSYKSNASLIRFIYEKGNDGDICETAQTEIKLRAPMHSTDTQV